MSKVRGLDSLNLRIEYALWICFLLIPIKVRMLNYNCNQFMQITTVIIILNERKYFEQLNNSVTSLRSDRRTRPSERNFCAVHSLARTRRGCQCQCSQVPVLAGWQIPSTQIDAESRRHCRTRHARLLLSQSALSIRATPLTYIDTSGG